MGARGSIPRATDTTLYRFVIVDDHPLFRGALSQALSAAFEDAEVLEAGSLDELTERLATAATSISSCST